ncbi:hypothetical protein M3P21_13385 [Ruegeria sp. 2012CJ41-6]|uniref:Lipoprotein n=1 Tax=Ruegeria spongiae TaxID=2942209 RepID=A0ABT0Q503_9RHOB|nr:hypothetical protein [Ruegeria spongiae]MCL6284522.1 hypothetical protein [Ruegeria spongiae]
MKRIALAAVTLLSACSQLPGPSVPYQPGQNLDSARAAFQACAPTAPKSGQNTVVGSYAGGFVLAGLIGVVAVAANEQDIRTRGEYNGIDRCLSRRGFERRELTATELQQLNVGSPEQRRVILDQLVGSGLQQTAANSF